MAMFDRIGRIIRANINDLLAKAEDPEKIINQTLMDMRQAQYEARMEIAQAIAEGKKLERDYNGHVKDAGSWLAKAEQAIKASREDLAREALRRKQAAQALADGLKEQHEAHSSMVDQLKTQMRALDAKIDEAERKRQLLLARQKRVEAQESVSGVLAKTDASKAMAAFDRMEQKIEAHEDRVSAGIELENDLTMEDEFAALEADTALEDELASLKAALAAENPTASDEERSSF